MHSRSSDDSSTTDSSDNDTENITSEIINVNNAFTELEELISSFSNSEMIQALADYKEEYETYVTSLSETFSNQGQELNLSGDENNSGSNDKPKEKSGKIKASADDTQKLVQALQTISEQMGENTEIEENLKKEVNVFTNIE